MGSALDKVEIKVEAYQHDDNSLVEYLDNPGLHKWNKLAPPSLEMPTAVSTSIRCLRHDKCDGGTGIKRNQVVTVKATELWVPQSPVYLYSSMYSQECNLERPFMCFIPLSYLPAEKITEKAHQCQMPLESKNSSQLTHRCTNVSASPDPSPQIPPMTVPPPHHQSPQGTQ